MTETIVEVKDFKGLNIQDPPSKIFDDELVECVNLITGKTGHLEKRKGLTLLHNGTTLGPFATKLIGHFLTASFSYTLAVNNGNLYRSSNGADWTLIGAYDVEWGVQYTDKFYMVRKAGTILEYDGTTVTAIAGSPTGTFCLVYKDRLFVLNTEATLNNRFYFSDIADFSATGWPGTNFIDVNTGDGDFLTCCAVLHDLLVVFKTRTTWGLYVQGPPEAWVLRNLNPEIGCVSKYTPRNIEGTLYFVGSRGVYRTDGLAFMNLSNNIQTVFENRIINLTTVNIDAAAWWDDKYIVKLHPDPSTNKYYVYDLRTQGWVEWVFSGGAIPSTFLEIYTATPSKGLYCGDFAALGRVLKYGDNIFTDLGVNYSSYFRTKDFDFGLPARMKRGKWCLLEVDTDAVVTLTHYVEETALIGGTSTGIGRTAGHKFKGPGYFRKWGAKVEVISATEYKFFGISFVMHAKRTLIKAAT